MNEELKIRITAIADDAKKSIRAVTNELETFREETEETSTSQQALAQKLQLQKQQLTNLKREYADIVAAQGKESAAALACSQQIALLSGSYVANLNAMASATASSGAFSAASITASNATKTMGTAVKHASSAYQIYTNAIEESAEALADLGADIYSGFENALESIANAWEECERTLGENHEVTEAMRDLYEEVEQLSKAYERFDVSADQAHRSARKAAEQTENGLRETRQEAEKTTKSFDGFKNGAKAAGAAVVTSFKAATVAVASIAVATGALAESTREYRTEQAKLASAFEASGSTAEVAKQTYNDLYRVLGESDTATEAAQNLAKLTTEEQALSEWTKICQGVYATFGDSLPIESLAEAANETAKTGEITGALADAVNWAGINEEEFAEQLFWCNTEAEREKLIRSTLNDLYTDAAAGYEENAASILAANEAQALLTESLAALGAAVEPLVTLFKGGLAETLAELVPGIELMTQGVLDMANGVEGGADKMKEGLTGMIDTVITKITELLPHFLTIGVGAITAILQGLTENFPQIMNALAEAIPQIITALGELIPQIVETLLSSLPLLVDVIFKAAAQILLTLGDVLPDILENIVEILPQIIDSVVENIPMLLEAAIQFLMAIVEAIPEILPALNSAMPKIIDSILDVVIDSIPLLTEGAVELFLGLLNAIPTIVPQAILATHQLVMTIIKNLVKATPQVLTAAEGVFKGIVAAIINIVPNTIQALGNLIKVFKDYFVDKLKSLLNFKFELPKIKVPRFSIKPEGWEIGDLLKGIKPTLGITWNARGGVFDNPTVFGYGDTLQGIGENGAEAVVPLENNTEWLDKIAERLASSLGNNKPTILQVDGKTFAKVVETTVNARTRQTGRLGINLV